MKRTAWARTLALGALTGAVVLGGGGRAAMHVIARTTTGTGSFTVGGTVTVILLGAVLVTLRGINPVEPLKIAVFFPVVILYGLTLQLTTYQKRTAP